MFEKREAASRGGEGLTERGLVRVQVLGRHELGGERRFADARGAEHDDAQRLLAGRRRRAVRRCRLRRGPLRRPSRRRPVHRQRRPSAQRRRR